MKILHVNCVYNVGSTGRIVSMIDKALIAEGHSSIICYGRGQRSSKENVFKTSNEFYSKANNLFSRLSGFVYSGCHFSTSYLLFLINKEKPDIVHLHCINGFFVNIFRLVKWLNKHGYKTVITLHAEFMFTANCSHSYECTKWQTGCGNCPRLKEATNSILFDNTSESWNKMYNSFNGFDRRNITVVSVSKWLENRSKLSPILGQFNNITIENGVETNRFKANRDLESINSRDLIQPVHDYVLHVTATFSDDINHPKGGYYLIEVAKKLPDITFYVVGPYSISNPLPVNIKLLGAVSNLDYLAYLYSKARVTVLTSKRETFSMVCAESLCCGTPVVGFSAGGPESIALDDYSLFSEFGNVNLLARNIEQMLRLNYSPSIVSSEAILKYSSDVMTSKYLSLYHSMLE